MHKKKFRNREEREEKRRRSAKAVSAQRGFLSCQSCRGSGLQLVPCSVSAKKSLDLTAADIFDELQKAHPALMRGSNPMQFGSVLLRVGLKRRHTKYGNVYEVVRRKKEVSPERVER